MFLLLWQYSSFNAWVILLQTVLLGLLYEELAWDIGLPSDDNEDCLPCLFLQFMVVENGLRVSKILQVIIENISWQFVTYQKYYSRLLLKLYFYFVGADAKFFMNMCVYIIIICNLSFLSFCNSSPNKGEGWHPSILASRFLHVQISSDTVRFSNLACPNEAVL